MLLTPFSRMTTQTVALICLLFIFSSGVKATDFVRGDVNIDGNIDIADAVTLLDHLFSGGAAPSCEDAADGNDDGVIDIADSITLLTYLFASGGPLSSPFPDCGQDSTPSSLTCIQFDSCPQILPPMTPTGTTSAGQNSLGYYEFTLDIDPSIVFIHVPGGTFEMGSVTDGVAEAPIHTVTLSPFFISKYEITNAQYRLFCDDTGTSYPSVEDFGSIVDYFTDPIYDNYPMIRVSWNDLTAPGGYLEWAGLALPTESQWEFSARGVSSQTYPWGNEAVDSGGVWRANYRTPLPVDYSADGFAECSPVNEYSSFPGPFGTIAQAGNVLEWCYDGYDLYPAGPLTDPTGPTSFSQRIYRGGSWSSWLPIFLTGANRQHNSPSHRSHSVGFRPTLLEFSKKK